MAASTRPTLIAMSSHSPAQSAMARTCSPRFDISTQQSGASARTAAWWRSCPIGSRTPHAWTTRRSPDRQHTYEGASLGGRRKRGALVQAIGISRGGRNSKLHALTDGEGGPLRFLLTGGNVADCRAADVLLDDLAPRTIVLADKAYDSNAIRDLIERQGAVPNILFDPTV